MTGSAVRPALLVFVEGLRTEETYVVDWHRRYREMVTVVVDKFRGGPLQLVEHAVAQRRTDLRDEKKGRGKSFDEIWCMFDRDEHPSFDDAIRLARDNGILVAVSNPCLELWFVVHFEDQTAWIDRADAQRRSKELLNCDKVLTQDALEVLFENYPSARLRAAKLDEKHLGDGSPEGENPSSSAWRIVESIRRSPPA